jgi:ATP-dependent helicase/nuclease subunit B
VIVPTSYARERVRRAERALDEEPGGQDTAHVERVDVDVCTPEGLVRALGAPVVESRGHRLAPWCADRAALQMAAREIGGWAAQLAGAATGEGRGGDVLHGAVAEMRRGTAATIAALARRTGRVGDLARLTIQTGIVLHAHGFADPVEIDTAAAELAMTGDTGSRLGAVVVLDADAARPAVRRVLGSLVARLGATAVSGAGAPTPLLTEMRTCPDADEEGRAALRTVIAAVERGVRVADIAVFHPPGSVYARIVRQHMVAGGVDVRGPMPQGLDRTLTGRCLLGVLDLAASDWTRRDVMRWLTSFPLAEHPAESKIGSKDGSSTRPIIPAADWDAVSAVAGVGRGASQWQERLAVYATLRDGRPRDETDVASRLARFMAELVTRASPPIGSWEAWASWATSLLDRYLVPDRNWPGHEQDAARQVRAALGSLAELDAFGSVPDAVAFRLAAVVALRGEARHVAEDDDAGAGGGVLVAPFALGRGLHLDTAVVVGLGDDPGDNGAATSSVLDDAELRIDATGALRTRSERRSAVRDDVHVALRAARVRRVGTVPLVDRRSGAVVRPPPWLAKLVATRTRTRTTPSFSAGVLEAVSPASLSEFQLRDAMRWRALHGDIAGAPVVRHSPRLAAAVEGIRARAGDTFTRFDGRLTPGLLPRFTADAPVSPTRLETYVQCPRRFLFDRVLGVATRPDPDETWQIGPADRGSVVHAILEEYVVSRLAGAPRSMETLLDIAEGHFARAQAQGLVGVPLLWEMERATIRRDLERFFREEEGLEPLAAEFSFGTSETDAAPPVAIPVSADRVVPFAGRADRVDRARSGALVVSDYKTGAQRLLADVVRDPVAGGRLLQLPVYALAARARFGSDTGTEPVLARYWLLSEHRSAPSYRLSVSDAVLDRFGEIVERIVAAVESGAFPGAPTGRAPDRRFTACRFCDFDRVCPSTRARQFARKRSDAGLAAWRALSEAGTAENLEGLGVAGVLEEGDLPDDRALTGAGELDDSEAPLGPDVEAP